MIIMETEDDDDELRDEPDITEWIQELIKECMMFASFENVSKVYMADYPEAQTDNYSMSSKNDNEDPPDMNYLLLP